MTFSKRINNVYQVRNKVSVSTQNMKKNSITPETLVHLKNSRAKRMTPCTHLNIKGHYKQVRKALYRNFNEVIRGPGVSMLSSQITFKTLHANALCRQVIRH